MVFAYNLRYFAGVVTYNDYFITRCKVICRNNDWNKTENEWTDEAKYQIKINGNWECEGY